MALKFKGLASRIWPWTLIPEGNLSLVRDPARQPDEDLMRPDYPACMMLTTCRSVTALQ
jgi:hypothetical protein